MEKHGENIKKRSVDDNFSIFRIFDFQFFDFSAKFGRRTPDLISKSCSERSPEEFPLIFHVRAILKHAKNTKKLKKQKNRRRRRCRRRRRRRRRPPVLWVNTISFVGDDYFPCGRRLFPLWETTISLVGDDDFRCGRRRKTSL